MKKSAFLMILVLSINFIAVVSAQTKTENPIFKEVEMLVQNGDNVDEKSVVITFAEDVLEIKARNGVNNKTIKYTDIESAEYSYSKNPRWKTGLGLGAASIVFPPLLLVAIPLGFSKHRRHWVTIKTADDYAVLKLSKSNRKLFIPTFETKSGVKIEAVGEDK
jgi:hypothetical protein